MSAAPALRFETCPRIADIPAAEWDALTCGESFVSHAWLSTLEAEGPAWPQAGWTPRHLLARDGAGRLVGAVPLYQKAHSDLEIGADFGWAMAHERSAGPYYPKLIAEVPATPAPGMRLLVGAGPEAGRTRRALARALVDQARDSGLSGLHLNFLTLEDWQEMGNLGLLQGYGIRFVWRNRGYGSFEDFLGDLKRSHRGSIRTERKRVQSYGLDFALLEGAEVSAGVIDEFLPLYRDTFAKYGQEPRIKSAGMHRLRQTLPDRLVLSTVRAEGRLVAGCLYVREPDALVAMFWGSSVKLPFLHFETTYYIAIDHAVARGIGRIDVGPIGDHKANRGFGPELSLAAYWFRDAGFAAMLRPGLERRLETVQDRIADLRRVQAVRPAA